MIFTARYLGPLNFGILAFALSFTGIFGVFSDFGLQPLTVREVSRDKSLASKYLANISGMKFVLVFFTFGLISLTIHLLAYPQPTITVVYLVGLSVVFNAFTTMFYSIFQAYEKMEYQSLGQILKATLMFSAAILAINLGFNVTGFAAIYFFVSLVVLIYVYSAFRIKFSDLFLIYSLKRIEIDWKFWKSTIKEALPFGLSIALVMIFYWIDTIMLSLMKGDQVVGWYNAAYRMVLVLLFIPQSLIAAIYPIMSRFSNGYRYSLQLAFINSFRYLTMLGIPIGVGTTVLAHRLILNIFGEAYVNSILLLQILVWSSVFIFMTQPFGNLLNCLNKQVIVTKITGACACFNILLNLILIPKFSAVGASIATVLTEVLSLILCYYWSLKINYLFFSKQTAIFICKVIFASMIIGLFLYTFNHFSLFLLLPSSVILFFLALYLVKGINKEDVTFMFKRAV